MQFKIVALQGIIVAALVILDQERKPVIVFESHTCATCHCMKWIIGYMELYAEPVSESLVKATQQCASAGKVDAIFNYVGI